MIDRRSKIRLLQETHFNIKENSKSKRQPKKKKKTLLKFYQRNHLMPNGFGLPLI